MTVGSDEGCSASRGVREPLATSVRIAIAILLLAGMSACATARIENEPLDRYEAGRGYGIEPPGSNTPEDLHVVLLFSGGGTRAAALAYGVLGAHRSSSAGSHPS